MSIGARRASPQSSQLPQGDRAMATTEQRSGRAIRPGDRVHEPIEIRTIRPVHWWAALGVIYIGIGAYAFGAWISSNRFVRTPVGPDPVPHWMKLSLWCLFAFTL